MTVFIEKPALNIREELSALRGEDKIIIGGSIDGTIIGANIKVKISATDITSDSLNVSGDVIISGTVDGRNISVDGVKLDNIEVNADVTDTTNVTDAGALMDSELSNITAIKSLDQGVAIADTPEFNGLDLSAIDIDIISTAVDVFVYDTTKDSDGGAWRHRTQEKSWYQETLNTSTRGATRKFPSIAIIIAETQKVTIYDGSKSDMPMWMVFNDRTSIGRGFMSQAGVVGGMCAKNGYVAWANHKGTTADGLAMVSFIGDELIKYSDDQYKYDVGIEVGVSNRDNSPGNVDGSLPPIVSYSVNDVAITILPNAPIDHKTGLPTITIAVATDDGVSIIKDDGTVSDSSDTNEKNSISFTEYGGLLIASHGPAANSSLFLASTADIKSDGWAYTTIGAKSGLNGFPLLSTTINVSLASAGLFNVGQAGGLCTMLWNSTENQSLLQYTTSDYTSGYMVGGIKGAWLADTVAGTIVGADLVANGQGWTGVDGTTALPSGTSNVGWYETSNGTYSVNTGTLSITAGTNGRTGFYFAVSTVVGQSYRVTATGISNSAGGDMQVRGSATIDPNLRELVNLTSDGSNTFIATSLISYISVTNYNYIENSVGSIDTLTMHKIVADRSVNNNGLDVVGSITRTAVVTGAELMGFSGFGTTEYLEQSYNSDLDFGTGDFSVMGWFNITTPNAGIIARDTSFNTSTGFGMYITSSRLAVHMGNSAQLTDGVSYADGTWRYFTLLRRDGVGYLYMNGKQIWTETRAASVTDTSATLKVGIRHDGNPLLVGSLALLRISATAPTQEQITKIYRDELPLFRENAQCTIFGTSDAITALAHDESTNLLHVGTSDGMSSFYGLRRLSNTTRPITTAISAVNNLIAEE